MTSFWYDFKKTRTFIPAIPDADRKKRKNEEEEEEEDEEEEEEDMRKMTYLHGGALVESFSPQGRCASLLFSVRLREGA